MPAPILLTHPSSLAHDTGGHPERAERIVAIERELAAHGWCGYERASSPPATIEQLTAVHPAAHVELIRRACERGGGALDADTIVSPGSYEAALHAAGGAVALVDAIVSGAAPTGFAAHRPPGHHATADRAMGFCLFNNVAVAVRHALDAHGLERVMVLDTDVHHGNGTNDVFHRDPRVLFVSIHQSPLYPGTGPAADVGGGPGEGFTVNLPVAPGSGDAVWCGLVAHVAAPLARAFAPQLLLISAGFDAHAEDPLAGCEVSDAGFATIAGLARDAGAAVDVPVGAVLEGGYALDALARGVRVTLRALAGGAPISRADVPAGERVAAARARLARRWPTLH